MARCHGFDIENIESTDDEQYPLPCFPSTVLYGHAAARGLDIKRWSIGLDTGCVRIFTRSRDENPHSSSSLQGYGRHLTALVLGPKSSLAPDDAEDAGHRHRRTIPYGDDGNASIVHVRCSTDSIHPR